MTEWCVPEVVTHCDSSCQVSIKPEELGNRAADRFYVLNVLHSLNELQAWEGQMVRIFRDEKLDDSERNIYYYLIEAKKIGKQYRKETT